MPKPCLSNLITDMKIEKQYSILLCSLIVLASPKAMGQTSFSNSQDLWHEGYVNELFNVRYQGLNPTRLSYNKIKTTGEAFINYRLGRGDYHAIDQSGHKNDLSVHLGGLKHFKKIDLGGHLQYHNISAKDTKWNSTLFLNEQNPFILCDSVASDATTESFQMEAALSYQFNDRLKAGLSIGLTVGSMSDQTDPRPKTSTSVFPITAGVDYRLTENWSVGLSAQFRLLNSSISYTSINPLIAHRYFLMKGMGDYFRRSTADESGYKRDYKGTAVKGELQIVYQPTDKTFQNYIAVSVGQGNEKATDGGSAYTFKGGDFGYGIYSITERLQWMPTDETQHNFILKGSYQTGNGDWYDQKKLTDTEHGNLAYYEVLSKDRLHKSKGMSACAEYRFDKLQDALPDFHAGILAAMNRNEIRHNCDDGTHKQEWTNLTIAASAGKAFNISKGTLTVSANGGYVFPMQDRKFDTGTTTTGSDNITDPYVTGRFEYESGKHITLGGMLDYHLPLIKGIRLGIYAKANAAIYNDNGAYYPLLNSTTYTTIDMGVYLNF